jgi:hypothetical protein
VQYNSCHTLQALHGNLEARINPHVYHLFNVSLHLSFNSKQGLNLGHNHDFPSPASIRERRDKYINLYHEAISFCPKAGYSYDEVLLLLVYHKPTLAIQTYMFVPLLIHYILE